MVQAKIFSQPQENLQEINQVLRILATTAEAAIFPVAFKTHTRFLQRIASKAQLSGMALLYPGGGFDAWTAFQIHPQCRDVVIVSRESFGSMVQIKRSLESMYMVAQEKPAHLDNYACQYNYDSERLFLRDSLNGGYELFKLATYLHWYPLAIEQVLQNEISATKITMADEQSQPRYIWHVHMDLGLEHEFLPQFLQTFEFGGMLLKAALDITNPSQDGLGFYKNILYFVKQQNLPIIMDRPLNQYRYTFFDADHQPLRISLGEMDTFGYLQGHNDSVEIAQGRNILPYAAFLSHERKLLPRFVKNEFN